MDQIIEDAGLTKDEYECRYFFTGANPNNYITFNDEDAGWRIISVECDGRLKIVKNNNIGSMAWDTSGSSGNNNWARPATLNTYLNSTYYNSLNNIAQSQIIASNFSIGAINFGSNISTQVNDENSNKWYGQIALPTFSEYIRTNSNKTSCGTSSLINNNCSSCVSTGWMDNNDGWWTLTPASGITIIAFYTHSSGDVNGINAGPSKGKVRPALYLSSEIKITSGTESDPYQISL